MITVQNKNKLKMANEKENCSECEGIGRKTRKTDTPIDEVLECKSCGGEGKIPLKMQKK